METAAWADHEGGASEVGKGEMRRWRALYANADVEEAVDSYRGCWTKNGVLRAGRATARSGVERMAFREAIMEAGGVLPIQLRFSYLVLSPALVFGIRSKSVR